MKAPTRRWLLVSTLLLVVLVLLIALPNITNAPPSFLLGIWHGLLAPWTLLARIYTPIQMYACPNPGTPYDVGFIIGVYLSLPLGWAAAIIAVLYYWFV